MKRLMVIVPVALAAVIADAIASLMIRGTLVLGERRELIPELLVLTHVRNTGAAYGLLSGQRWLLVISAAAIAALTPLLLRSLPDEGRWRKAGTLLVGLITGGALGNLAERAMFGYVTDYLQMPAAPLFQVFNLSDVSISIAIAAFLGLTVFADRPRVSVPPRISPRQKG